MGDKRINAMVAIRMSVIRFSNLYIFNSWQLVVGSGQELLAFNLQTANCKLPTVKKLLLSYRKQLLNLHQQYL